MKKKVIYGVVALGMVLLLAMLPIFSAGQREEVEEEKGPVTVTLGYNAFLSDSFTDAPAPIDVIRSELAKKYPNINLDYYTMPLDMLNALTIWMTAHDATIDIYGMDTPWVQQFGRGGWALPLNDKLPSLEKNYVSSGLDTFSYEGKRLAVPFWGSVAGLFYRTDILEQYNLAPPKTVDEMMEICRVVLKDQPDLMGFAWPGAREEFLVMAYSTFLYAFGGQYTDDAGNYLFNSLESAAAVGCMKQLIDERISPRTVVNWKQAEANNSFTEGRSIFLLANLDIAIWLDDPQRTKIAGKWDVMPFPAQKGGESVAITGGFGFSANPYSEHMEETIQVLEVIASEEVQKGFALSWGPVQYYKGLYEDEVVKRYNPNVEKITPLLDVAKNRPPSSKYAQLSGILQEGLHSAITGTQPIAEALNDIQNRATALGQ